MEAWLSSSDVEAVTLTLVVVALVDGNEESFSESKTVIGLSTVNTVKDKVLNKENIVKEKMQ